MFNYFLLLSKHKNLSLKRTLDYKRNLIITVGLIIFSQMFLIPLFAVLPKEDIKKLFPVFLIPVIIIIDFSLRFFLKKNANAGIIPYFVFPIPRKVLIFYIILSDLQRCWIWGTILIYGIFLYCFDSLTCWNTIVLLLFILLNNYFIFFVKALLGGYAILTYPICLGFIFIFLLITNLLSHIFAVTIISVTVFSFVVTLFFTLKENIYEELNSIAL